METRFCQSADANGVNAHLQNKTRTASQTTNHGISPFSSTN